MQSPSQQPEATATGRDARSGSKAPEQARSAPERRREGGTHARGHPKGRRTAQSAPERRREGETLPGPAQRPKNGLHSQLAS
jgi:hypothetical protein